MLKKERMFCGVIIKLDFCRKNSAKMLTLQYSEYQSLNYRKMFIQLGQERNKNIQKRNLHEELHEEIP